MTDRTPRVTIGLPVYNGQAFVRSAIESILAQTYTDFELVICDNASTDDSPIICTAFAAVDPRIRYHRNDVNLGAAPNFNKVFRLGRGHYFKWAAADDRIEPDFLRRCVEVLDADPTAVLCHTRPGIIDLQGNVLRFEGPDQTAVLHDGRRVARAGLMDPQRPTDSPDVVTRLRALFTQTQWCFEDFGLIRADALRRSTLHKGFYGSDKVLLVSLALQGRFVELPEPLFLRRFHPGQSSEKSVQQQATWMDARAKRTGRLVPPQIRCFASYIKLLSRARLNSADRLRCFAALLQWCGWLAYTIYRDRKSHGFLHRHWYARTAAARRQAAKSQEPQPAVEPSESRSREADGPLTPTAAGA